MVFVYFTLDILSGFMQLITEKVKCGIHKLRSFQIFSPLCVIGGCLGYSIVGMLYCNNRAKHTLRSFTKIAFRGRWV